MTTDRVLPEPLLGRPVLGRLISPSGSPTQAVSPGGVVPVITAAAARTGAGTKSVRSTNFNREALLSTPARAGMLIGVSAAVYAVSLAGVAGLQFQTEAATAEAQAPIVTAVERTRAANDALEAALLAADSRAQALEADYAKMGPDAAAFQQRLNELASLVAQVQGSAAALPASISLPTVKTHGAVARSGKAPATAAVTSASGKP